MPENGADQELKAIQAVIAALTPLDLEARSRVIDYVFKRLGLSGGHVPPPALAAGLVPSDAPAERAPERRPPVTDIRSLKEQKAPRNSVEMAALVAYYLAEVAPATEKQETIGTAEIQKYFKQADFPLPGSPRLTLFQGKNAGYFDSAQRGQYKLNPVGHNLIAHNLPAKESSEQKRRPSARRTSRSRSVRKVGKKHLKASGNRARK